MVRFKVLAGFSPVSRIELVARVGTGTAALADSPRYPHNVLPDGQASVNQSERHVVMGRLLAAST